MLVPIERVGRTNADPTISRWTPIPTTANPKIPKFHTAVLIFKSYVGKNKEAGSSTILAITVHTTFEKKQLLKHSVETSPRYIKLNRQQWMIAYFASTWPLSSVVIFDHAPVCHYWRDAEKIRNIIYVCASYIKWIEIFAFWYIIVMQNSEIVPVFYKNFHL